MEFRTPIDPKPFRQKIDYSAQGLSIGSCFAESIAARMQRAKFPVVSNPFGVLYNPASVANALDMLHSGRRFTTNDLVCEGDLWSCFSFHGSFSSTDPERALEAMNSAVQEGRQWLAKADYVILTFGTAWIYELSDEFGSSEKEESVFDRTKRIIKEFARPRVVANCHKLPARAFNRRRLTVSEIVEVYRIFFDTALADKHIILTVSPVRHIKDGLVENNVSKATLILAASKLAGAYDNVDYFPSFEIVNDELRDYRFYKEDMMHPSEQAIEYIWEKFRHTAMTKKTLETVDEVMELVLAAGHRPLNPDSAAHRRFLRSMLKKAEALAKKNPGIDLSPEIDCFGA